MTLKSLREIHVAPFLGTHETRKSTYMVSLRMPNAREYLKPLLDAAPNLEDAEDSDDTEGAARRTFYKEYHKLVRPTFLSPTIALFTCASV